jgi:alkanesulfonate monooxygenase SsuD/methylene tetrahydromethanopterin reductase-like flavin-dependent oxidoreductase (luciferase family)
MLAVISGDPRRFAPYVDLYQSALEEYTLPPLPIGVHSHGYVAKTDEEAVEIQWPHWQEQYAASSRERGWPPPTFGGFQAEIANGSLYVGSPETVATKVAATIRTLGLSRFDFVYGLGGVPHEQKLATIELYGSEVIPRVRELLASAPAA